MASDTRTSADEQPPDTPDTPTGAPVEQPGEAPGEDNSFAVFEPHAPGWLRLARAVAGVALLAFAWGMLMVAALLAVNTLGIPPHRHVIVRVALYIVGAVGALWLGVVAVAALIVGAFCLTLALTRRQW